MNLTEMRPYLKLDRPPARPGHGRSPIFAAALALAAASGMPSLHSEPIDIQVTIENLAPAAGVHFTPFWVGFHDGGFDLFDPGEEADLVLERLAEDGDNAALTAAFMESASGSEQAVIASGGEIPPFAPGSKMSRRITLDPQAASNRYLSYAAMVLPSNDAFIGNDDPLAIPVFGEDGRFNAGRYWVTGDQVWDAGTEENDEAPANTAFFGQATPDTGVEQNGVVEPHTGFMPEGNGGILDDPMFSMADFTANGYRIARITVAQVFQITRVAAIDGNISLQWSGGQAPYQVQSRTSVGAGEWTDLGELTDGLSAMFPINEGHGFFRVVSGVSAPDTARYDVTFDAFWSAETHPTDFPTGSAHWSGLVGATHNEELILWQPGAIASPGIENMAETGSKSPLSSEIQTAIDGGLAEHLLSGNGIGSSPGTVQLVFDVSQSHSMVSLTSMIAPSPDWFVGIHGLPLFVEGRWQDEVVVDLFPYDAGTDNGATYTSPNADTQPRQPITRIESAPFLAEGSVAALGKLSFRRIQ